MAGAKKKKKPAANPARGFATTSVASKPRTELSDQAENGGGTAEQQGSKTIDGTLSAPSTGNQPAGSAANTPGGNKTVELTPEEFEAQLETSELQLLVEKHAAKVKRDANRQKVRLETDRRLLRSQSERLNVSKWIPAEVVDQILDLVSAESRFGSSGLPSESSPPSGGKMLPEEDLIVRLWTLRLALVGAGFKDTRVDSAVKHVLDMSPNVSMNSKDTIWGLEESLDWLARECQNDELPSYEGRTKAPIKATDNGVDNLQDSPLASDAETAQSAKKKDKKVQTKRRTIVCNSDIEPDDLIPDFLETKTKLFKIEGSQRANGRAAKSTPPSEEVLLQMEKLKARLDRIEKDVLFDRGAADVEWRRKRVELEKEFAALQKAKLKDQASSNPEDTVQEPSTTSDDIAKEAEKMAADLLAQDGEEEDQLLANMFANLPTTEVDAATGKTTTVMNDPNGSKITLRDFGKWSGISPLRVLEEACRARDSGVSISYSLVSQTPFANRHMVTIRWKKLQDVSPDSPIDGIETKRTDNELRFAMKSIATPTSAQSEAFIATYALFHIFSSVPKEEKLFLRLPPVWRELWTEYVGIRKDDLDTADRKTIKDLRDIVRQRQDRELEDGVILQSAFRGRGPAKGTAESREASNQDVLKSQLPSETLQRIWAEKSSTPKFQAMLVSRTQLPMWSFKEQVINAIDNNQVTIVCGETGCGKSTQLPSFILENQLSRGKACKIFVTEPRRISAISLARRVSEELGENRADLGTYRSLVGFSIRLEAKVSRETRLVFATTGIVMRMLEGSNDLHEVTHLILDEVHERSIDSDFLLIVLKRLMKRRPDLKVVLMSATVDADRFSSFLDGAPVLTVPGRTFPVQARYLEDAVEFTGYTTGDTAQVDMVDLDDDVPEHVSESIKPEAIKSLTGYSSQTRATLASMDEYVIDFELIQQLIIKIATDSAHAPYSKAILVFLPGMAEIRTLNDMLLGHPFFSSTWCIYPLHSSIATEDQEQAFLIPPPGMRKVVLATNIAETGITIPDVTCVIDTGKHKEMRFDERRQLSRLIDTFISRANAKQRRGRAGRVQEGLCFHLFTKYRHDRLLSDQQTPEMLRLSLQDLAIRVKICKLGGVEDTLNEALDPPSAKNIRRAIDALIDVRAFTQAEDLTPLGHQLARLPLDVFLGKLLLLGTVFKCLDMALTVAAILSSKSPFSAPFGQRAQANAVRASYRRADSDLLTIYNAYLAWKRVCQSTTGQDFQFCRKNYLSQQTLSNIEDLKGQLLVSLVDSSFLVLTEEERRNLSKLRYSPGGRGRRKQNFFESPQRVNMNSEVDVISASVIAWSFYPKLLVRDTPGTKGLRNIGNNQSISIHPTSVNRDHSELKWLSYYHIMQSKQVYRAHETTAVDPFAIVLMCGDIRYDMFSGIFIVDGNRARFAAPDWKTMLAIKALRSRLRELLSRSFRQPGRLPTPQQERWLEVWQKIFAHAQELRDAAVTAANS